MNLGDVSSFQDQLYLSEIPILLAIQKTFDGYGDWLQNISKVGDPALTFIFWFPLIFALNALSGVKFLGAIILSEWMNLNLKWLLHGERPYWWTRTANIPLNLEQTPITCETGPGNPSGHVMISVVLWLSVYDVIVKIIDGGKPQAPTSPLRLVVGRLLWNAVLLMLAFAIASRTFIAAHFLHQCILALFFGLFAFKLAYEKLKWTNYPFLVLLVIALMFPLVSLSVHEYLEQLVGFSPDWSIAKATKWCQDKSWINLDTIPLHAMVRFSGSAMGLVFAIGMCRLNKLKLTRNFLTSPTQKTFQLIFGLLLGQISSAIHNFIPRSDMQTYYMWEYVLNASLVFAISLILPLIVKNLFSANPASKKRKNSA